MFFKKKKYITINNPQKSRKNYDLTYDNVAIPEVHTHEASDSTNAVSSNASVSPFFCIQYIIWNYFFAKGGYYVQHIRLL